MKSMIPYGITGLERVNHTPSLFSSQFSPASSLSTFTQHLPSLVQTLWRTQRTQLSSSHITQGNFSFKPLGWKMETNLAACSVIAKSSLLNYTFTRLWTLLLTAILGQTAITHADSHCLSWIRVSCSRAGGKYCMLPHSSGDVDNCRRHEMCGGA